VTPRKFARLAKLVFSKGIPGTIPSGWHKVGDSWYDRYNETTLFSMDSAYRESILYVWASWLMKEHGLVATTDGTTWVWKDQESVLVEEDSREDAICHAVCLKTEMDWASLS